MLVVAGKQITLCSVPSGSPELTVGVHLAKLGALVRAGRISSEDALLLHQAGAQADALAGVFRTQEPDTVGHRI